MTVHIERRDSIAIVTLDRPEALNAVNGALALALGEALETAETDDNVQVIVLTGRGRTFCAGADLKAIAAGEGLDPPGHPDWGFAGITRHRLRKPTIAAVNGAALGGGTEIVLACDLAVMSETAHLGLPEVRWGLFPAGGGTIRLPREMPPKIALEHLLSGAPITAVDAARWGLVNRVVPPDLVMPTALELAASVAANGPIAVRAAKRLANAATGAGSDRDAEMWAANADAIAEVFTSQDAAEGMAAFVERRTPGPWLGR
ncbi:enoyl-CoA hydratase/isomerase family protein [Nakamurella leprariae]|uniref:enoyl-CoA hydratase n=1 Tax=Nakamurella leprariae TaxID=2803911 RepID=A0A938YHB6_9ACTN|nr:enoyl-CoA hydratase-related protein [Nakamurella leprariae]MBM9467810.1 enoyl-CoA hydratase/isomerase family protein [Nakamurella leprariae]